MVDEQMFLTYAFFPPVAFLGALVIVGFATATVFSVMFNRYEAVPNQLSRQPIEIEGEERAA